MWVTYENNIIGGQKTMSNSINSYRRGLPQEYGPQRTIYRIILGLVLAFAILIPARLAAEYKTEFADTVVLSSGDLPYNVPQSNLLILTSGNLYAAGTAINVGDRNDIMIDGGGDTIFFGSAEGDFVHGVRMSYSPERIQIKNITLIHDVPDATLAEDCSPIHLYGDDSVWVKNVNMVSRGVEGNCIDATTKYGNGISNLWVEDCECDNRAHSYYSRNADPAAAFRVCADISTLGAGEYTGKFENVTVTRTPHSAIYAVGGSDNRPVMIIHDCSLTVDAHNDMYDTTNASTFHSSGDPFAISVFRLGPGSQIYNNVIRSGNQYEGGQGMMIQGAQGTASNPVEIYNNDVQVHCGPTQADLRYGGDGKSIGFYLRWPEGDSKMSNCYVKIRDNIFKTYADALTDLDNGGTAHTGGSAQGIRIHADSGFHNCELVNNRVFAMRSDSLVDTGYVETVAAMIAKVDTNRSDSYALTHMQDVHDNVFKGNYYYALSSPLYIGSVAQHLLGGGNLIMYADTLHCPEPAGGNTSVEFPQYGTFRYSSTGSRLLDYTYLGYSNDEDIKWGNINTDCNGLGKDLRYDRIATIKVKDDQGNDLSGATVTIVNNYGQLVASGTTDAFGEFTDTVTYKARHYNSPYDDGSCYWEDSLLFNDFTIKAKYGGDSSITTLAINAETAFPFNMSLNGGVPANNPPSTPVLADPADGATQTSTTPVLTTGNSTDPEGDSLTYSFQVALSSDFSSIEAHVSSLSEGSGDNTSWTVSPELVDGNVYYWRVRAFDGNDYSDWSDFRSFSIEVPNSSPSVPVLASPDDSASVEILRPVLTLNNSNDPEGDDLVYDIQISTSETFIIPLAAEYGIAEGTGETTSWTVPNDLSDGVRYFWRARAYDGGNYSGWSEVWTFVVDLPNNAPTTPVLATPTNGSSVNTLTPVLVSNNSADVDGDDLTYDFQVSSNSSFSSISAEVSGLSEGSGSTTGWTVNTDLTDGNTYFWRVRATDGEAYSGWSQVRSFTIDLPNNVPTAPVLASPGNGETVTSLSPELSVNNSTDDDNDALTYHFQVSSNSNFTAIVAQQSGLAEGSGSTTSWTVNSSLSNQTNFWWRVRAYDGEDYSVYSQTSVFYVDYTEPNDPPEPPQSDQPPAGDSVDSPNPILVVANSVDPDGDDLSYHFEVWNDQQSELIKASPPVPEESGSTTSWEVDTALEDGQQYHWRARSFDGSEYADWTSWSNFYVEMSPPNGPPSTPTIVLPNDGDTLIGSTHTLVIGNSNDPDGDEITYEFLICSDSGMSQTVEHVVNVAEGTTNTTFITSATLEQGNTYCWHARACDGQDSSAWSETRSFVHFDFTAGVDDIPIPESPLEGEVVRNLRPTFRIQTDESDVGVDFYFEVSDNPEFANPISSGPVEGERNKTSWRPDQNLVPNFTYYWRAKAEKSGWCEVTSFSTKGNVHVSPNPFRPDKDGEEIVFRNLPQTSDITITTVSGDIVYRMQEAEGPEIVWNGRNYNNEPVASGVYLYFVSSPDSSESGKIAVIR